MLLQGLAAQDREPGIDLGSGRAKRERNLLRISRRSRQKGNVRRVELRERHVDHEARRLVQRPPIDISRHADHAQVGIAPGQRRRPTDHSDDLPHGVALRPESRGHLLADDDDRLPIVPISVRERTPLDNRNTGRSEEIGTDDRVVGVEDLLALRRLVPID